MAELAGGNESILRLAMEPARAYPATCGLVTPDRLARQVLRLLEASDRLDRVRRDRRGHLASTMSSSNGGTGEAVDCRQGYRVFVVQVSGSGDYEEAETQCASVDRAVSVTYGEAVSVSVSDRRSA